jgi:hypothetical protein
VKVQCELCREIVPLADFTPSAEGISIRCPACNGRYYVPAPIRAAPGALASELGGEAVAGGEAESEARCPKCGRRQPQGAACRHCGLVFALWDPDGVAPTAGDDEAQRHFALVEAAWGDRTRHEAFIEHCARTGQLPYAARCYRDRLARDPDDSVARAQQARVVAVAELTCLTQPRELADSPVPYRGVLIGAVLVLFVILLGVLTSPLWRWWK